MPKKAETPWWGCPIRFGVGVFGDRWTLLVLRDLMFKGKARFGEFGDPEERLATNILADRLKKLEAAGMVTKSRDPNKGTQNIYRLTEKSIDLLPVMLALINWSETYDQKTGVPRDFIRGLRKNPKAFERRLRRELEKAHLGDGP